MIKIKDTNSELLIYIKNENLIVSKLDNETRIETQLVNVFTDLNMTIKLQCVQMTNDTGLVQQVDMFYFNPNDFIK